MNKKEILIPKSDLGYETDNLVEKHEICIHKSTSTYDICKQYTSLASYIRNKCLFYIRQYHYTHNTFVTENIDEFGEIHFGKIYAYANLYKEFCKEDFFKNSLFNTKVVKQIFMAVHSEFAGYEQAIKAYFKDRSKFLGMPRMPNYKDSDGKYKVVFPYDTLGGKGQVIELGGLKLAVRTKQNRKFIPQVIISPGRNNYLIQIVYRKRKVEQKPDNKVYGSIDLGMTNLITFTANKPGVNPLLIKGSYIKNLNHQYLHQIEKYGTGKKLTLLETKRKNQIDDYFNKIALYIVKMAVDNGINRLVIGYNPQWKSGNIALSGRLKKHFALIPYYKLIAKIKFKAYQMGIMVDVITEEYTSKCSFLDNEDICRHEVYKGKRAKRGVFVSSDGYKINADVNASLNILRKKYKDVAFDRDINRRLYTIDPTKVVINL